MQELEQLIRKFWLNEASPEEHQRLLQLLQESKDQYRETIKDKFGTEEEVPINTERATELLTKIHHSLGIEDGQPRIHRTRRLYTYMTIAAAVLAVVFSIFLMAPRRHDTRGIVAVQPPTTTAVQSRLEQFVSSRDSSLTLEDGTRVRLKKNSRLAFHKPFQDTRRDIWLEGSAIFDVAKDKKRPLTVYSGEVTTRVLGTRFSVNGSETSKVRVRLLEGKIVVNTRPGPGVYLTPGQEFSFDKNSKAYTINTIHLQPEKTINPNSIAAGLIFHKEPLGRAFDRIGGLYKTSLSYRTEELEGLYFTGTFLQSDDLHVVLTAICTVNNLVFIEEKDSIIITRSH